VVDESELRRKVSTNNDVAAKMTAAAAKMMATANAADTSMDQVCLPEFFISLL
jgi:hypothetical protein